MFIEKNIYWIRVSLAQNYINIIQILLIQFNYLIYIYIQQFGITISKKPELLKIFRSSGFLISQYPFLQMQCSDIIPSTI